MAKNREMDNLAKDAAAALAAGMSYGRYMALRYKPPVQKKPAPKKEEEPKGDRICKICGAPFFAIRHNQLCCSYPCSRENSKRRANELQRLRRAAQKKRQEEA